MATTLTKQETREYKDISFSMLCHPESKNLLIKSNINSLKQSVINLLTLSRNTKPFHPEISSPVYNFLFENFGVLEKIVLEDSIRKYLTKYEPRLLISKIELSFPDPAAINCSIEGTLINTNESFTVNVLIDRLR